MPKPTAIKRIRTKVSAKQKQDRKKITKPAPKKKQQADTFNDFSFHLFANTSHSVILIYDEKKIFYANEAAIKITGYRKSELLKMKLCDLVHPEDKKQCSRREQERLKSRKVPTSYEMRIISKKGEVRYLDFTANITEYKNNSVAIGIADDITEKKKTEQHIRESQAGYRTLFEGANDAIFIMKGGLFISCNEKTLEMFKCKSEQIIGKSPIAFSPARQPDGRSSRESAEEKIRNAYKGIPQYFEWKHTHLDGTPFDAEVGLNRFEMGGAQFLQAIVRDVTERKKSEEDLKKSEHLLRSILEMSNIAMAIVDLDGTIEYINRQAVATFGYLPKDIPTMDKWWKLAYPDKSYREEVISNWMERIEKAIREGCEIERHEYKVTCKDKSLKSIIIFGVVVENKVFVMFDDITERKRSEEALRNSEERYRNLVELSPEPIIVHTDGVIEYANNASLKVMRASCVDDFIGKPAISFVHPDYRAAVGNRISESLKTDNIAPLMEEKFVRFDGEVIDVEVTAIPFFNFGKKSMLTVFKDVTEVKKAQQEIKDSEERFRLISGVASDYMFSTIVTPDGNLDLNWVAGAFEKITGYSFEEYKQRGGWRASVYPDDIAVDRISYLKLQNNQKVVSEIRTIRKNGEILWVKVFAHPVWDEKKECLVGIFGGVQDINERKKTEEALAQSSKENQLLLNSTAEGILGLDHDGNHTFINKAATEMLGYTAEEVIGRQSHRLWHHTKPDGSDYPKESCKILATFNKRDTVNNSDEVFWRKDGSSFPVEYTSTPIIEMGSIVGVVVTFKDITERRKVEEALRQSEEKYRTLIDATDTGFVIVDTKGNVIDANRKYVHMTGHSHLDEIIGRSVIEWTSDRTRAINTEAVSQCAKEGFIRNLEIEYIHPDGTVLPVWISATVVKSEGGTKMMSLVTDITDRKKIEEELRSSEERYRTIFELTPIPVALHTNGIIEYVNKACIQAMGASSENDLIGKSAFTLIHPDYKELVRERIRKSAEEKKEVKAELEKFIRLDGACIDVEVTALPFSSRGKNSTLTMFRDITELKKAEDSLRESESRYRSYIDNAPDGVLIVNDEGKYVGVNPAFTEIIGYSADELRHLSIKDLLSEESQADGLRHFYDTKANGSAKADLVHIHKNGSKVWLSVSAVLLSDDRLLGFVKNISDRKKAEDELQKSRLLLRSLIDTLPLWITAVDKEGNYIIANNYYTRTFGTQIEQIEGHNFTEVFPSNKHKLHKGLIDQCIETKQPVEFYDELEFPNRKTSYVFGGYNPLFNTSGEITGVTGFAIDISDLKNTEENLKQFKFIVDNTTEEFYLISPYGKFEYVNNAAANSLGYTVEELMQLGVPGISITFNTPEKYHEHFLIDLKGKKDIPPFETMQRARDGRVLTKLVKAAYLVIGDKENICSFAYDISETKKATEIIKQNEEKFRLLFTSTSQAVTLNEIILDQNGEPCDYKILDANPAFEYHTGLKVKDIIGKKVLDILPGTEEFWIKEFGEVALTGKPKRLENYSKELNKYFDFTIYCPRLGQFALISTDITDRKREEETKKLNTRRMEAMIRLNQMTDKSLNELTDYVLEEAVKLTGSKFGYLAFMSEDEKIIQLHSWSGDVMSQCTIKQPVIEFIVEKTGLLGEPIRIRKPVITNDYMANNPLKRGFPEGHVPIKRHINVPVFDGDKIVILAGAANKETDYNETDANQLTLLMNGLWRIIQRRKAEEALRNSERQYRLITDNSNDIIVKYDTKGRISYVSPVCQKLLGYEFTDFFNHSVFDFFHPDDVPYLRQYQEKLLEQKAPNLIKHRLRKKDGDYIWFETNNQIILEEDGSIKEVVAVIRDITELLHSEELLKEKEAAEMASKAKSEFLANMSHEIRNPLNSIIGLSNSLARTPLSEEQINYIESLKISSGNLMNILNAVLDFSKIEANKVELQNMHFSIREAVSSVYSSNKTSAENKDLNFSFTVDENVPEYVVGDCTKLKQILLNLTGNAIKFTEKGSISISVKEKYHENHISVVRFEVTDTGIGIKEEDSSKLFQSFTQVDSSTTKQYAGTGLGLAIVKRYAEIMNGTAGFSSQHQKGSTFYAEIPFIISSVNKAEQHSNKSEMKEQTSKPPILLVEDDGINQLYLKGFLNKMGYEVDTAFNGIQALEKYNSGKYSIILMDGQMPKMDGFEATRKIREKERNTKKRTFIIAITGYAVTGDKEKFMKAGMDDYISKPIDETKLIEIIQQYSEMIK